MDKAGGGVWGAGILGPEVFGPEKGRDSRERSRIIDTLERKEERPGTLDLGARH